MKPLENIFICRITANFMQSYVDSMRLKLSFKSNSIKYDPYVAAAGLEMGSAIVKCQKRGQHWNMN